MRHFTGKLNILAALIGFILLIQFVLGMEVNLFVSIPAPLPHTQMLSLWPKLWAALNWALSKSDSLLASHSGLGVLLLAVICYFLCVAHRSRSVQWVVIAWSIVLSVLFAAVNGLLFLIDGQQAINSLWMAVGFALSLALCGYGIHVKDPAN